MASGVKFFWVKMDAEAGRVEIRVKHLRILSSIILFGFQSVLGTYIYNADVAWVDPSEDADHWFLAEFGSTLNPSVKNDRGPIWTTDLFRVASFGYLPVAIDWFLIQAFLDPAIAPVEKGSHPLLYYRLDLLTNLDPAYFDIYFSGANILSVIRKDGEGARALLLKGVGFLEKKLVDYPEDFKKTYWDNPWSLYILLAYVYLFHLDDLPKASSAFREAANYPGAPSYLIRLKERLERAGGQYDVGIKLLKFLKSGTKDERVIEKLDHKIKNLSISQFLFEVNEAYRNFLRAKSRKPSPQTFSQFVATSPEFKKDPWGGELSLNSKGIIRTSTPFEQVLGLN